MGTRVMRQIFIFGVLMIATRAATRPGTEAEAYRVPDVWARVPCPVTCTAHVLLRRILAPEETRV